MIFALGEIQCDVPGAVGRLGLGLLERVPDGLGAVLAAGGVRAEVEDIDYNVPAGGAACGEGIGHGLQQKTERKQQGAKLLHPFFHGFVIPPV